MSTKMGNLIVTMKLGDRVFVDDDLQIQFVFTKGKQIKLRFTGPEDVVVLREKLYNKILEENKNER